MKLVFNHIFSLCTQNAVLDKYTEMFLFKIKVPTVSSQNPKKNIYFIQNMILPTKICGQVEYSIHQIAESRPLKIWKCFSHSEKTSFFDWIFRFVSNKTIPEDKKKLILLLIFSPHKVRTYFNQLLQKFCFAGSWEKFS